MIDDKKKAELDQTSAFAAEFQPAHWWSVFQACQKEGFTEGQAMELLKVYVSLAALNGVVIR